MSVSHIQYRFEVDDICGIIAFYGVSTDHTSRDLVDMIKMTVGTAT